MAEDARSGWLSARGRADQLIGPGQRRAAAGAARQAFRWQDSQLGDKHSAAAKMAAAGLSLPVVGPYQVGTDFEKWVRSVELYLAALDITAEGRKKAVLLHLLGPELQAVYDTLPAPEGVTGDWSICIAKLKAHLAPERSAVADRLAFKRLKMGPGELFDQFLGRLRQAAARCGFAQPDDALRDQLIAGCTPRLQERILQRAAERDTLTLKDVIAFAHTVEKTERLLREVRQAEEGQPAAEMEVQVVHQQQQQARQ